VFQAASEFCRKRGTSIAKLALQFASQNSELPTTLFSSANPESVRRNVEWHEQPFDMELVAVVQEILTPVRDKQWEY
jgi:aryl-alcohol dehydrogenase-like predicted oxidoreductase